MLIHRVETPEHWAAVVDLDYECFKGEQPVHIDDALWYIAIEEGIPIGFAGLQVTDNRGFLCKCGVAPEYRGGMVHKWLIAAREIRATTFNIKLMITHTHYQNLPSINNLISSGYKVYQPKKPQPEFIYWKKLL
jgi:hypothetical protein